MWQKLKDQIPSILVLAALVIGGVSFMFNRIDSRQREELAVLKVQNNSLRDQALENSRQFAATNKLLQDALKRNAGAFPMSDAPVEVGGDARLARLADLIAQRMDPRLLEVKSVADLDRMQREETNRIATRLTNTLRPALASAVKTQDAATADVMRAEEQRIAQLNANVRDTQAAAQDAVKLSHELSALYSNSFKDQGVVVRLLSLPVELIQDTAKLNLVTSREQAQVDRELAAKMNAIDKRLTELQMAASRS